MTKPLSVLQLLPRLDEGGVERGILELTDYLHQHGHRADVISAGGKLVKDLLARGGKHHTLDIGRKSFLTLRHVLTLRRYIQETRPDIVHVRSRFPAWINHFAFKDLRPEERPKLISTVHGAYSVNRYSQIMLKADRVIAISDYIRSYITQNYSNTTMNKVAVIYRGVNTGHYHFDFTPPEEWTSQWYQQQPQTRNKLLLCLPGRITRLKGHQDFIQLCKQLKSKGQAFHAVMVGGYSKSKLRYFRELQQNVKEQQLEDEISFLGSRSDLRNILSISDLVFSLSKKPEAFGRTSLEALSLGTPVIAYDHGGSREILQSLCPSGLIDLNNIQMAVERSLQFAAEAPEIKPNNLYTLSSMLEQTLSLYQQAVESNA